MVQSFTSFLYQSGLALWMYIILMAYETFFYGLAHAYVPILTLEEDCLRMSTLKFTHNII
jgi:hypothetical protein